MTKEIKKNLFWFLIIFVFIVLITIWQIFSKIFHQKRDTEDNLIKSLVNQRDLIKESFDKLLYNLKEIKFINSLPAHSGEVRQRRPGPEEKKRLTNEELEKLKEKVLEHVD